MVVHCCWLRVMRPRLLPIRITMACPLGPLSSRLTTSSRPSWEAKCSGVWPALLAVHRAPCEMRRCTASTSPAAAALYLQWGGGEGWRGCMLGTERAAGRWTTAPCKLAYSGLQPLESQRLGSAPASCTQAAERMFTYECERQTSACSHVPAITPIFLSSQPASPAAAQPGDSGQSWWQG